MTIRIRIGGEGTSCAGPVFQADSRRSTWSTVSTRAGTDARRGRPPPDRRGPSPTAVGGPRGARARARRRGGHVLRGVGAERPCRSRGRATGTAGTAAPTRCARWACRASGPAVRAGHRPGRPLQVRGRAAPTGRCACKADPMARQAEVPPATASVVTQSDARVERRRLDAAPRAPQPPEATRCGSTRCTSGSWRPGLDYREAAHQLADYVGRPRVHPRRAAARRRAPLRRLVGLPGHRLLRPDVAVRHARRLPLLRRPPPPARHRRHRRLGAGPLPEGRLGAGPLRRHRALRARRPAPGRAPRLGHARLQLRPQRGAQLPRRQRPLLVRRVPHRRAARRRGRVDALPRLLPRARASGCRTSSAAARTSTPSSSSGAQHRRVRRAPRRDDDRRGDRRRGRW